MHARKYIQLKISQVEVFCIEYFKFLYLFCNNSKCLKRCLWLLNVILGARKSAKYVMTVQLTSSLPEDELWKVKQLQNDSKELTDIERTDNSTTVDYKTNETDSRELEPASKRLKVAN